MTSAEYDECASKDPDVPDSLYVARMVSCTDKEAGERGIVKMYRDMKTKTPDKFLQRLEKMEADFLMAKSKLKAVGATSVASGPDEGTDKCVTMCEQLLRDLTKGVGDGKIQS